MCLTEFNKILLKFCKYLISIETNNTKHIFYNPNTEHYIQCSSKYNAKCGYYLWNIVSGNIDLEHIISELSDSIELYISVYEFLSPNTNLWNIEMPDLANLIYANYNEFDTYKNNDVLNVNYNYNVLNLNLIYSSLQGYLELYLKHRNIDNFSNYKEMSCSSETYLSEMCNLSLT